MKDLVSLIVPVYNGERWLDRFWGCVENQTYENIELIMVDDGSDDNTLIRMEKYAKCMSNISVYHIDNSGPSVARNFGLEKAKGEYIAFADVDDIILPDYITYLYDLLIKYRADMASCSYIKVSDSEKYSIDQRTENEELVFTQEDAIKNFCYRRRIVGSSCLKLIKSGIAKRNSFPEDIVYGEDFTFTYELLKKCNKVVYGNSIQYIYIQHKSSITHKKGDNTEKYQASWKKYLLFLNDVKNNYYDSYLGAISKCYIIAINNTARIYDKKKDVDVLKQYYQFIKDNAKYVYRDKENKTLIKLLGLVGWISVKGVCTLSKAFFIMQERFKWTFKRTL